MRAAAAVAACVARAGCSAPAPLLAINARVIHTMESPLNPPNTNAFCVIGGKFDFIGSEQLAREHCGGGATVLDLEGGVVVPGMIDAHVHIVSGGRAELAPKL